VPLHLVRAPIELTGKTKLVNLDNIRTAIDSSSLASLLAAPSFTRRVLGESKVLTLPNRLVLVGTGNHVRASGEIAKRSVPIHLHPSTDAPEDRDDFRHADLSAYVAAHAGEGARVPGGSENGIQHRFWPGGSENGIRHRFWPDTVSGPTPFPVRLRRRGAGQGARAPDGDGGELAGGAFYRRGNRNPGVARPINTVSSSALALLRRPLNLLHIVGLPQNRLHFTHT